MKKVIKQLLFFCYKILGLSYIKNFISNSNLITILLYHEVSPDKFEKQIKYLISKKYQIVPLKETIYKILNKESIPSKSIIITFDDGLKGNYRLLDVIKKYNVKPTIFITTSIVGTKKHFWDKEIGNQSELLRYLEISDKARLDRLKNINFYEDKEYLDRQALSMEEIYEMSNFVDFQPHSKYHPVLKNCIYNRKESEIKESREFIEKKIKNEVYAFAPPYGIYDSEIIDILKKNDFKCSLTINPGKNYIQDNLYELKRIGVPENIDINEFLCRIDGVWDYIRNIPFIKNKSSFYKQYYGS